MRVRCQYPPFLTPLLRTAPLLGGCCLFLDILGAQGLLTELCGQHCEVVPDMSLTVQGHRCADGAIIGLDREAALQIRVGEDGVPGEDRAGLGAAPKLAAPSPFLPLSFPPFCSPCWASWLIWAEGLSSWGRTCPVHPEP